MDGTAAGQIGARTRRNTISDAFRRSALRHAGKTALTFEGRSWSYAELDRAATRVARRLLGIGLRHGDRVGAYGRNSDAYLILWLACCRAGLVHVPINYALTGRELSYIVEQSGARALIFDPKLAALAGEVAASLPTVEHTGTLHGGSELDVLGTAQHGRDDDEPGSFDPDVAETDLVQLLYTSGTTAATKGAMMTHHAFMSEYVSCIANMEFTRDDRVLAALPLYHVAQMHAFMMPQLLLGATQVLLEAPTPDLCLRLIEAEKITSFFAPPTVWISLLRHPDFDRRDLSSLRYVFYGASIMPVPVLQELRQRLPGAKPFNCYGQSEIAPMATLLRPEEHEQRPASAGRPLFNVETRVVDPDMHDVPTGERGEIIHRSPHLMLGYWNEPEETREAFAGGWFHSGDVGTLDAEGYLYVVDRVKDVIKTGGTMVASREVEEALFTHPAVSEVAVIALPDPKWIEAVTAVVVLRPGHAADGDALIAHSREQLAPYKVPKRVIFRDDLPRNTAGKLLKRELRAEYAAAAG